MPHTHNMMRSSLSTSQTLHRLQAMTRAAAVVTRAAAVAATTRAAAVAATTRAAAVAVTTRAVAAAAAAAAMTRAAAKVVPAAYEALHAASLIADDLFTTGCDVLSAGGGYGGGNQSSF